MNVGTAFVIFVAGIVAGMILDIAIDLRKTKRELKEGKSQ